MKARGVIYNRTFGPQRFVPKYMSFGTQPDGCPGQPRGRGSAGQGHKVTGL